MRCFTKTFAFYHSIHINTCVGGSDYTICFMCRLVSVLEFHFFHHRNYIFTYIYTCVKRTSYFNPLSKELNPICHLLALLEAHHILHVSRIRVTSEYSNCITSSKDFVIYLYIMVLFDVLIIRTKQALLFSVFASRPTFLPASCKFRDNTLK